MPTHPSTTAARRRRLMKIAFEVRKSCNGWRWNDLMNVLGLGFGHGQPWPDQWDREATIINYQFRADL